MLEAEAPSFRDTLFFGVAPAMGAWAPCSACGPCGTLRSLVSAFICARFARWNQEPCHESPSRPRLVPLSSKPYWHHEGIGLFTVFAPPPHLGSCRRQTAFDWQLATSRSKALYRNSPMRYCHVARQKGLYRRNYQRCLSSLSAATMSTAAHGNT